MRRCRRGMVQEQSLFDKIAKNVRSRSTSRRALPRALAPAARGYARPASCPTSTRTSPGTLPCPPDACASAGAVDPRTRPSHAVVGLVALSRGRTARSFSKAAHGIPIPVRVRAHTADDDEAGEDELSGARPCRRVCTAEATAQRVTSPFTVPLLWMAVPRRNPLRAAHVPHPYPRPHSSRFLLFQGVCPGLKEPRLGFMSTRFFRGSSCPSGPMRCGSTFFGT